MFSVVPKFRVIATSAEEDEAGKDSQKPGADPDKKKKTQLKKELQDILKQSEEWAKQKTQKQEPKYDPGGSPGAKFGAAKKWKEAEDGAAAGGRAAGGGGAAGGSGGFWNLFGGGAAEGGAGAAGSAGGAAGGAAGHRAGAEAGRDEDSPAAGGDDKLLQPSMSMFPAGSKRKQMLQILADLLQAGMPKSQIEQWLDTLAAPDTPEQDATPSTPSQSASAVVDNWLNKAKNLLKWYQGGAESQEAPPNEDMPQEDVSPAAPDESALEQAVQELESAVRTLELQLQNAIRSNAKNDKEVRNLRARIAQLNLELNAARAHLQLYNANNQYLRQQNEQLQQDQQQLQQFNDELQRQLEDGARARAEMQNALNDSETQASTHRTRINELEQQITVLHEHVVRLFRGARQQKVLKTSLRDLFELRRQLQNQVRNVHDNVPQGIFRVHIIRMLTYVAAMLWSLYDVVVVPEARNRLLAAPSRPAGGAVMVRRAGSESPADDSPGSALTVYPPRDNERYPVLQGNSGSGEQGSELMVQPPHAPGAVGHIARQRGFKNWPHMWPEQWWQELDPRTQALLDHNLFWNVVMRISPTGLLMPPFANRDGASRNVVNRRLSMIEPPSAGSGAAADAPRRPDSRPVYVRPSEQSVWPSDYSVPNMPSHAESRRLRHQYAVPPAGLSPEHQTLLPEVSHRSNDARAHAAPQSSLQAEVAEERWRQNQDRGRPRRGASGRGQRRGGQAAQEVGRPASNQHGAVWVFVNPHKNGVGTLFPDLRLVDDLSDRHSADLATIRNV